MRHWRLTSWLIIIWTALFAFWGISGANAVSNNCAGVSADSLAGCQAGTAIGAGIGLTFIFGIWFVGFIVLSIIWFMRKPSR